MTFGRLKEVILYFKTMLGLAGNSMAGAAREEIKKIEDEQAKW